MGSDAHKISEVGVFGKIDRAEKLIEFLKKNYHNYEILIIDSYSKDKTQQIAKKFGKLILCEKGKGNAIRKGIKSAKGEILIFLDADLSHRIEELPAFIKNLKNFDMVKGSRFLKGGGSEDLTFFRKLLNFILVKLTNFLYHSNFTDICYGYFGGWKKKLSTLNLCAKGFEIETEIFIKGFKRGFKIKEIPSFEKKRKFGKGKLRLIKDGFAILKTIVICLKE